MKISELIYFTKSMMRHPVIERFIVQNFEKTKFYWISTKTVGGFYDIDRQRPSIYIVNRLNANFMK